MAWTEVTYSPTTWTWYHDNDFGQGSWFVADGWFGSPWFGLAENYTEATPSATSWTNAY